LRSWRTSRGSVGLREGGGEQNGGEHGFVSFRGELLAIEANATSAFEGSMHRILTLLAKRSILR
jgi:hypothetical protein